MGLPQFHHEESSGLQENGYYIQGQEGKERGSMAAYTYLNTVVLHPSCSNNS
jgi:hypothetical protein